MEKMTNPYNKTMQKETCSEPEGLSLLKLLSRLLQRLEGCATRLENISHTIDGGGSSDPGKGEDVKLTLCNIADECEDVAMKIGNLVADISDKLGAPEINSD